MGRINILLYTLVLTACVLPITVNAQSKSKPDSLTKYVTYVEDEMSRIDLSRSPKTTVVKETLHPQKASKKVKVTADIRDSIVRKLVYNSYDDSFMTSGKEVYYFDTTGKLISHVMLMTGMTIHEIYVGKQIFVYSKSNSKVSSTAITEVDMVFYQLATTKYIVDFYLSSFEGVKYYTFDVSGNTSRVLKTLVATELRRSPDNKSPLIKKLNKGAELQYLSRSVQRDAVISGKDKWVWIKVRDNKNQEGWIWGHPSIVTEY